MARDEPIRWQLVLDERGGRASNEIVPAALADLEDRDNNHLLCLDTADPAVSVSFPAGHLVDPRARTLHWTAGEIDNMPSATPT